MQLVERFKNLLVKIGFNETDIILRWSDLHNVYSGKSRHYHNLSHLEEMIALYEIHLSSFEFPDEILYSIFYHDYVYKVTRKDNELKSAEHALSILPLNTTIKKQLVFDMILATQHHKPNKVEDINWLVDFDLKILAKDWEDYKKYFEQIRKEYKLYPNFLYNPGRKKALEHFIANEFIFQTEEFRNNFEGKARENIKREIELLGYFA
jgi:predicted metal-dependent HD superfamily phosphohydrolase